MSGKDVFLDKMILVIILSTNAMVDSSIVDITTAKLQKDSIKVHNTYRNLHGAHPLIYSKELEDFARKRAKELAQQDRGSKGLQHPDDLVWGENLAYNSKRNVDFAVPLKIWYEEWKIYNFKRPNTNHKNGHFTQMVWKGTKKIGCAQALSNGKNRGTYTVCNYDPPGNYINEELKNVLPKKTAPAPIKKSIPAPKKPVSYASFGSDKKLVPVSKIKSTQAPQPKNGKYTTKPTRKYTTKPTQKIQLVGKIKQ